MALQLQFRHDCQNLGCANTACNLCKLSQRRRCPTNFAAKYLAPCDVVEAKCGAQIYVVVQDEASGQLVQQGLEELAILISIIDARKFEAEAGITMRPDEALERCELLENKQGQALLAHGRSGSYTDSKKVLVPMIHGQALLPDLKITDSSEALLTGRAPPFRLSVRAVHRSGEPFEGVAFALSEPFVVATARVKGAAKLEIPHVDDHVSKIDCVGLQTQKKLEDIKAAAVAAGVPDLNLPVNTVVKVGQFRDLVEAAERNKALRETLKQVLRLTKGWDVARDHVRKAVETDVQLRVYHPDGRTEVGLVFKCGSFNTIDINRPIGLMRRKQNPHQSNQELVDVIWLPVDTASFPDAVKRMLPQASTDWRKDSHLGWALLPLTTSHMPPYSEGGKPTSQTSSFTFTIRSAPGAPGAGAGAAAPPRPPSPRSNPAGPGGGVQASAPMQGMQLPPMMGGVGSGAMDGFGVPQPTGGGGGGLPLGLNIPGLSGGGLGGGGLGLPPPLPQQQQQQQQLGGGLRLPPPLPQQQQQQQQQLGQGGFMSDALEALRMQQQRGMGPGLPSQMQQHQQPGLPTGLVFGQQQQQPPAMMQHQHQHQHHQHQHQHHQQQQPFSGLAGDLSAGLAGLDPGMLQSLMQMPNLDLFSGQMGNGGGGGRGAHPPPVPQQQPQQPAALAQRQQQLGPAALPPELANLLKEDSLSPFEDPNFQQLMSMVAANAPPGTGRGPAPSSSGGRGGGGRDKVATKRKADTSLETWMGMNKSVDLEGSLPAVVAPLESLFTSMLPGGGDDSTGDGGLPPPAPVGFFPAMPSAGGEANGRKEGGGHAPKSPRAEAAASGGGRGGRGGGRSGGDGDGPVKSEAMSQQQQQQPSASGAMPMEVAQPAESSGVVDSGTAAGTRAGTPRAGGGSAPMQADGSSLLSGGGGRPALAPAPEPLVKSVTLEDMQAQFARAMRQEISFAELEQFLKQYNLLPSGQSAGGAAGAAAAAAAAAAFGAAVSGGLEDMQTIEQALPSGSGLQHGGN